MDAVTKIPDIGGVDYFTLKSYIIIIIYFLRIFFKISGKTFKNLSKLLRPSLRPKDIKKQGRIVHRSGLNNENNKIKKKNSLKSKIKDFIFNSTMVKADIFWVTEKYRVY